MLSVSEFKAKCLAYLSEIEETGGSLTITRRGRPVAVVGPVKRKRRKSSRDSWAGRAKIVGDIISPLWWEVTDGQEGN